MFWGVDLQKKSDFVLQGPKVVVNLLTEGFIASPSEREPKNDHRSRHDQLNPEQKMYWA